jgi:hypothetical protein
MVTLADGPAPFGVASGQARSIVIPPFLVSTKMANRLNCINRWNCSFPIARGQQLVVQADAPGSQSDIPAPESFAGCRRPRQVDARTHGPTFTDAEGKAAADALKSLFAKFGSDKSTGRNYHHLYGEILKNKDDIALRSRNRVGDEQPGRRLQHGGSRGMPGASLRPFREYLPNATIIGADVDKRILFQGRPHTDHFVDQTDLASLESLGSNIPDSIDLIIDDGLHSPNANLAVLAFGLGKLKNQAGWSSRTYLRRAVPVWDVCGCAASRRRLPVTMLRAEGSSGFCCPEDKDCRQRARPSCANLHDAGFVA